jgi:hypothetical protein
MPLTQGIQPLREEKRRLLAISEDCRAQEHAAAHQLLRPPHSLLRPTYMRLVDAYQHPQSRQHLQPA